jgi:hypothetical protein
MTAHPTLIEALRQAVSNAGQPESLYRRLESWLDALSTGSTDLTKDREDTRTRMQDLIDAIKVGEGDQ